MDPNTGRIIAAASYPTYDPSVFVGGISVADYRQAHRPGGRTTRCSRRAIAGAVRARLDVQAGQRQLGRDAQAGHDRRAVQLPGLADRRRPGEDQLRLRVDTRLRVDLKLALQSRATRGSTVRGPGVLRRPGAHRDGQEAARVPAADGAGLRVRHPSRRRPAGRRADHRQLRRPRDPAGPLEGQPAQYCADAAARLPRARPTRPLRATSPSWPRRTAPTAGATAPATTPTWRSGRARRRSRRCSWRWPTRRWSTAGRSGSRRSAGPWSTPPARSSSTISPTVKSKVPVSTVDAEPTSRTALQFPTTTRCRARSPSTARPYKTELGGKTGTAEVYGKQDTSWLASWGPVSRTRPARPSSSSSA